MHGFPCILLQMEALNTNRHFFADITVRINGQDINLALTHNRMFKLRNLIALRQVDIEIILAIKAREEIDFRVKA